MENTPWWILAPAIVGALIVLAASLAKAKRAGRAALVREVFVLCLVGVASLLLWDAIGLRGIVGVMLLIAAWELDKMGR